ERDREEAATAEDDQVIAVQLDDVALVDLSVLVVRDRLVATGSRLVVAPLAGEACARRVRLRLRGRPRGGARGLRRRRGRRRRRRRRSLRFRVSLSALRRACVLVPRHLEERRARARIDVLEPRVVEGLHLFGVLERDEPPDGTL